MWKLTADPTLSAPDEPGDTVIDFERGMPVKLTSKSQNEATDPTGIFLAANALARKHGASRIDIVENRFIGLKSRGCPALLFSTMLTSTWKA
jgi:argininosuccinate synthase